MLKRLLWDGVSVLCHGQIVLFLSVYRAIFVLWRFCLANMQHFSSSGDRDQASNDFLQEAGELTGFNFWLYSLSCPFKLSQTNAATGRANRDNLNTRLINVSENVETYVPRSKLHLDSSSSATVWTISVSTWLIMWKAMVSEPSLAKSNLT